MFENRSAAGLVVPTPGRRAVLGALGASILTALPGCAAPQNPEAKVTAASAAPSSTASPSGTETPTPAPPAGSAPAPGPEAPAAPPIRRTFVPDYHLPPVVDGLAPVVTRIITSHPVVFLTIDDGNVKTPEMVALMAKFDYPASLFLTKNSIVDNPGFFKAFRKQGSLVENHTVSHNTSMVRDWSYQQQLDDIAGMQDYALQQYGRLPALFRPPGGAYSLAMRQAVAAAGMKAIINWEAKANAGRMDYQVGNALRPGDIVLMHFRPEFAADLAAFREAQLAAGLEVVLLESFLGVN